MLILIIIILVKNKSTQFIKTDLSIKFPMQTHDLNFRCRVIENDLNIKFPMQTNYEKWSLTKQSKD